MNKVLLVSGVEQSDSVIHIYLFFSNYSPLYMLLYIFEQSALCYTVANQSIFLK